MESQSSKSAAEVLASRVCLCTEPKQPGFSFCGFCYHNLPADLSRGLWRKGPAYE